MLFLKVLWWSEMPDVGEPKRYIEWQDHCSSSEVKALRAAHPEAWLTLCHCKACPIPSEYSLRRVLG